MRTRADIIVEGKLILELIGNVLALLASWREKADRNSNKPMQRTVLRAAAEGRDDVRRIGWIFNTWFPASLASGVFAFPVFVLW